MRDKIILLIAMIATFIGASTMNVNYNQGSIGVCTKNVSTMQPRFNVPRNETHRERNGTRWVNVTTLKYTTQYVKVWRIEKTCCPNYRNETGRCEPYCNPSCKNGNCTKPNHCKCHRGYEKSEKANVCVKECKHGETRDRRTGNCVPTCEPKCVNGKCVAHNTCQCDRYFKPSSYQKHACVSMCSKKCKQGTCTGHEQCTCDSGYRNVTDKYTCVPQCQTSCYGGWCDKPNKCKCNEPDYRPIKQNQACEPVCKGCEHGNCTAPNQCVCNRGYDRNLEKKRCEPKCPAGCKHGWCKSPEVCECNRGYVRINSTACRPARCNVPCFNGQCLADDYCKCNSGYVETFVLNVTRCTPYCKNNCFNGVCISPNNCSCNFGFYLNEKTSICDPICNVPCVNGFSCVAPNQCGCRGTLVEKSVKTDAGTTLVQECVSGGSEPCGTFSSTLLVFIGIVYSFYH